MISANRGLIRIKGGRAEILSDFATITHVLIQNLNMPATEVDRAVELAKKTETELAEEFFKTFIKVVSDL